MSGGPSFRAWQRAAVVDGAGSAGVSSLRATTGSSPGATRRNGDGDGDGGYADDFDAAAADVGVVAARGRTNSILKQAVAMTFAPEPALSPAARVPPSWWRGDPGAFAAASAGGESRAAKYSEAKYRTSPPGVLRSGPASPTGRGGAAPPRVEPPRSWGEAGASSSFGERQLQATFDGSPGGVESTGAARAAYAAARAEEEERIIAARRSEFNATQAIARRAFEVREAAEAARRARETSARREQAYVQERWRESINDAARGGEWR